jgi:hypothetical protein
MIKHLSIKKHVCKSYTHAYGSLLMKEIFLRFNIEAVFLWLVNEAPNPTPTLYIDM